MAAAVTGSLRVKKVHRQYMCGLLVFLAAFYELGQSVPQLSQLKDFAVQ